jgi:hypothetical protein
MILPPYAILRGACVFVALLKAGRVLRGAAPVYHAVTPFCRPAFVQM